MRKMIEYRIRGMDPPFKSDAIDFRHKSDIMSNKKYIRV